MPCDSALFIFFQYLMNRMEKMERVYWAGFLLGFVVRGDFFVVAVALMGTAANGPQIGARIKRKK